MRVLLGTLALLAVGLAPGVAGAHGAGHAAQPQPAIAGDAADAQPAIAGPASVGGYRVDLVAHPAPLAAGLEHRLVARVATDTGTPVRGASVLVGVASAGSEEPRVAPATEVTWAGSYEVPFVPARRGPYQVRVVLAEVGGRPLEPAAALEFRVAVGAAPGAGAATWLLVALLGLTTALALHAVARTRRAPPGAGARNLLDVPWIGGALRSRTLTPAVQGVCLLVAAGVVYIGVADLQDPGVNVATKLTWTIWWAGIIFTFVLLGRAWCVACPFGALNEWAARLAGATRRLPKPFRNLWWATGLFLILTWADERYGVVRSPRVTAGLVIVLAVGAVVVGLVYARRSFCRYLCPIGGVIGLYSMAAPLELRSGDARVCTEHGVKECYKGRGREPGCPMFEFPQVMDRNMNCTFCGACVRSCSSGNLVLRLRPFGKDLWASARGSLDEAYLAAVLVGLTSIVTAQMLAAWPGVVSAAARWLPEAVRTAAKPVTYLGALETALLVGIGAVAVPGLLVGAAWVSNRLAGGAAVGVRRSFIAFAYGLVPVGLGMHLAHNLAHLLQEGGGIVPSAQRALLTFTPFSAGLPEFPAAPLAAPETIALLQYGVVALFFLVSLLAATRIAGRLYPDARAAAWAALPVGLLAFAVTAANLLLLAQPMGMRHAM